MHRRAFLRRMIFAGLATWFLDLPLPREAERVVEMRATLTESGDWYVDIDDARFWPKRHAMAGPMGLAVSMEEHAEGYYRLARTYPDGRSFSTFVRAPAPVPDRRTDVVLGPIRIGVPDGTLVGPSNYVRTSGLVTAPGFHTMTEMRALTKS